MMYVKLVLRNIKRSTKEYAVYLLTLTLSVTLLYAFNGVALSNEVKEITNYMDSFLIFAIMASILIVFVLAWLVYYISKFVLETRSREFGMYMLMGMRRKQVTRMFLLEQICMGTIAYVIGCFIGTIVYQIMQAVILNLFSEAFSFHITFSLQSGGLTLLYFVFIFVLELFRESHFLKKKQIHELLYSDKKNEKQKGNTGRCVIYVVLGILMFLSGLKVLDETMSNRMESGLGLIISVTLIAGSIIFIYMGLSHVITMLIDRNRNFKYKGNTLYLSRQVCTRLKTSRAVLALLTILTLSSFLLVSMGLKFNQAQTDGERKVPFDITCEQYAGGKELDTSAVTDLLQKKHIAYQDHTFKYFKLPYDATPLAKHTTWERIYDEPSRFYYIRYSDYQVLAKLLGYTPKKITQDEYMLITDKESFEQIDKNARAYTFENLQYATSETRELGQLLYNSIIIVVPDTLLKDSNENTTTQYVVKSEVPSEREWTEEIEDEFLRENSKPSIDVDGSTWLQSNNVTIKADWIANTLSSTIVVTFTLIYIAIILACVGATVLAIQQMSDVWKQKRSYHMLWKMGVDRKAIHGILRKQIAIYFFVPLIIPVLYIFPIIIITDQLFQHSFSSASMVPFAFFSILFYLMIYTCYYLLAYFNSKHSIEI